MSALFPSPARSASRYVFACVGATVVLMLLQFLMAGLALFKDGGLWACHVIAGFLLVVPIVAALVVALKARMRIVTRYASALLGAYVVQVGLVIAGKQGASPLWQSLHPFNGALMLVGAVALLMELIALRRNQRGSSRSFSG
ncbi:hypothetical protein CDL60_16760 [Roseateles noduli]|nr:hypothetical protein CDL60_16760 [Roseateles noduli]